LRRRPGESDNAVARAHDENSWPWSKAAHEQPLAVNGENSRAKVQNVRGDSSAFDLSAIFSYPVVWVSPL
jgi:hypothetical protein